MIKGFYFILLFILVFVQYNGKYEIDENRMDDIQSELSLSDFEYNSQLAFYFDIEEYVDYEFEGELIVEIVLPAVVTQISSIIDYSELYSNQFFYHFSDSSPPSISA